MTQSYGMTRPPRQRLGDRAREAVTFHPSWWATPAALTVGGLVTGVPEHGGPAAVGAATAVYAAHGVKKIGEHMQDDGMAGRREITKALSKKAARKTAATTRPRLAAGGAVRGAHPGEYGIELARRGGRALYATHRDVVAVVAPPQVGKTATLGGMVLDFPGSGVVTSTKPDIHEHTAALRSLRGPVHVFNPEGLGGISSTFRWSPVLGCEDPSVAIMRAGYLLSGSSVGKGTEDQSFWEAGTVKLLSRYLFAAAIAGHTMREVAAWCAGAADETPLTILKRNPATPHGWARDVDQIMHMPAEKTRESIYLTTSLALEFMGDPALAVATLPEEGHSFDVERFVRAGGGNAPETLYLLGADRQHGSLSSLFAAFTGELFETAKRIAADQPGGRLDPPVLFCLDEAALICPVPLPRWTADAGGRGIPIIIAVQSPSQLVERWGDAGAETIWNNANIKLIFGGLTVRKHLEDISAICGERDDKTRSTSIDRKGVTSRSVSIRRIPVLAVDQIRGLRQWEVLILHRNTRPLLARITPVWERRDVKAYAKAVARAGRTADRQASQAARVAGGPVPVPDLVDAAVGWVPAEVPAARTAAQTFARSIHPAGSKLPPAAGGPQDDVSGRSA